MKRHYSIRQFVAMVVVGFVITVFADDVLPQSEQEDRPLLSIQDLFTTSGWMGDGEYGRTYIQFDGANRTDPHSQPTCIKIEYIFGPKRWGGIFWQNKPDNWGDERGNDYSKKGFQKVSFWAKGKTGTEIVEFKAGGINNPLKKYHDSFEETVGRVTLTKEWKQYIIDLSHADLSNVIGGFCWVASADYNTGQPTIVFYLDDIFLE